MLDIVYTLLLQLKDLRVGQEEEPCIGFTQENSIESSIQDCLPYILKALVHANDKYSCPNAHALTMIILCVFYAVNMPYSP